MLGPVSTKLVDIHRRIDDVQMAAHWGVFTECTLHNIRKVLERVGREIIMIMKSVAAIEFKYILTKF
ncbi:hypothetical protein ANCCAN_24915 [Ancylostoma caninum]|uniref:Uncharacterized protein n=1 Tax=Ancylostoma caninum TaxID=29170 RepID=A0A368FEL8_ANCCA|nr:hypothetical protein ANCCAN_24915 [Ancylostoma caninum]